MPLNVSAWHALVPDSLKTQHEIIAVTINKLIFFKNEIC